MLSSEDVDECERVDETIGAEEEGGFEGEEVVSSSGCEIEAIISRPNCIIGKA